MHVFDNIDKKIITILSKNARISLKHLAEEVHLSSPAVKARLDFLENSDYIQKYNANLNYEKLGFPVTAFIQLTLDPNQRCSFNDFIHTKTNVLECYQVAGSYSMLIKGCFKTPSKLYEFVGKLQTYGKTETQIVFSCVIPPRNIPLMDD